MGKFWTRISKKSDDAYNQHHFKSFEITTLELNIRDKNYKLK